AELMGMFGFDWFWIDMEHAPLEIKEVQTILQAMGKSETAPIVRVPWNDPIHLKRVLDLGPAGVIVPWVNSEAEAKAAVRACMYPPKGIRGCGPRRASWGTGFSEYVERANENVTVIVQLESRKAMANLGRILSVSGVNGTMIGPADLSASLGFPGHPDNSVVQSAIKDILKRHTGSSVSPGIASSPQDARKHIEMGFKLVNVGSDMGFMESAAVETLNELQGFLRRNQ
ncbi:4-hydroxy-2-oxo-heptane-1,7-dioate aldolase, partial [bacterium]